jgi:hypothetical protein
MSIKGIKIPKILFIKGIFKKDCQSDDIFEKKILENANIADMSSNLITIQPTIDHPFDEITTNFVNYEKLPPIFSNIETWKHKTNLLCWNCALNFNSIPVFIPKVIEPLMIKNKLGREKKSNSYSISVYGVFCTFGCAKQYIESHNYSISDRTENINKLNLLHKLFFNHNMKEMTDYPNPHNMKSFGGDMTVEEFRANIKKYIVV